MRAWISIGLLIMATACETKKEEDPRDTLAPGVISTQAHEYFPTFTLDGQTVYFSRADGLWGQPETQTFMYIFKSELTNNQWSSPEIASFSGQYNDSDPFISPDGTQLFFTSNRPISGESNKEDADIWMISLDSAGTPQHLGNLVNSPQEEYSPIVTANGRLYFASWRDGGEGQGDFYYSDLENGDYQQPVNIYWINTQGGEWNLYVDPTDTYMIFEASGRIPKKRYGDLYISFRGEYDWEEPKYLDLINTYGSDIGVRPSHDGKKFYYASLANFGAQASKFHVDNKTAYHTKSKECQVDIHSVSTDSLMASLK